MAAQPQQPKKVLRIGIIQDGKIVQERLIKAGTSVVVGESAKNTFVFPKTHLPKAEFPLFLYKGGKYFLNFTEKMKGKVSSSGAVVALAKLRNDPSVTKKGGTWQMPLSEQDRGKIAIDSVTVLFQFVAPPPARAVKGIQAMDFRARMIEDDDPVFLGFLAIWSALAVVFMIWVWNTEPAEFTLEQLPDRFTKMVLDKKPEKPKEIEKDEKVEEDPTDAEGKGKKEEEAKAAKPKAGKDETKVEKAKRIEQRKEKLISESKLLLKIIGTTGESSGGVVENLWSGAEQGFGDIDKALSEAGGGVTTDSSEALRTGAGGKGEAADIGEIGGAGGGTSEIGAGPAVQLTAEVTLGDGTMEEDVGDQNAAKTTVRRYSGQLKYCYESRLKADPNLSGRVEVSWYVSGGAVSDVFIVGNTTGDAELGSCIEKKVKRWKFPDSVEGEITWPFVFRAKK
jgi:hypothetical protein